MESDALKFGRWALTSQRYLLPPSSMLNRMSLDFNIKISGNPLKSNLCISSKLSTMKKTSVTRLSKKKFNDGCLDGHLAGHLNF